MYAEILFGLSTSVHLVQPCSHVCWYFIQSCSMYVGIFFGLSIRLVRAVRLIFSIFMGMHVWLSSVLPQSTAC